MSPNPVLRTHCAMLSLHMHCCGHCPEEGAGCGVCPNPLPPQSVTSQQQAGQEWPGGCAGLSQVTGHVAGGSRKRSPITLRLGRGACPIPPVDSDPRPPPCTSPPSGLGEPRHPAPLRTPSHSRSRQPGSRDGLAASPQWSPQPVLHLNDSRPQPSQLQLISEASWGLAELLADGAALVLAGGPVQSRNVGSHGPPPIMDGGRPSLPLGVPTRAVCCPPSDGADVALVGPHPGRRHWTGLGFCLGFLCPPRHWVPIDGCQGPFQKVKSVDLRAGEGPGEEGENQGKRG